MLGLDAEATVRLLGTVWLPRIRAGQQAVIRVPLTDIPPDLPPLLKLVAYRQRGDAREPSVAADPAADLPMSDMLLSPWLEERTWTNTNWAELTTIERWRWLCGLSIDIRILDHFIVAGPQVYSFAEHGLV